jgi:hypothetical protein
MKNMKKIQKVMLMMFLLTAAFATASFAQECKPKSFIFNGLPLGSTDGDVWANIAGKTGGCNKFRYLDKDEDERTKVTLTSTDGKARFQIKSIESGTTYSNLTSFNQTITAGTIEITVTGTDSTDFNLKIYVFMDEQEVGANQTTTL